MYHEMYEIQWHFLYEVKEMKSNNYYGGISK